MIQIASKLVSETYAKVPQRFFRKSARHLDFWRLGFSILLQKSVVYRPITSKEDSKGRRMDMVMIFSSSKRWMSIFFSFFISRSPFIFDFCLMQPVTKFFYRVFWGFLCAQDLRGSVRGSVQLSQKLNMIKICLSKTNYTYNSHKQSIYPQFVWIFAFFYPIIWEIGLLGAPWGAPWLHKFYHRKIWTKTYKKHIYHFFI